MKLLLFLAFIFEASALDFGVGLELGALKNSVSESDVNRRLRELGSNGNANISSSLSPFYRLFGHYQLSHSFHIEFGLSRSPSKDVSLSDIGSLQASKIIEDLPIIGTGLDLRILYRIPLGSRFALMAGVGAWRWSTSVELNSEDGGNRAEIAGTDPTIHLYGVYKRPFPQLPPIDLRLQLSRFYALEQTNDIVTLAVTWGFNKKSKRIKRKRKKRRIVRKKRRRVKRRIKSRLRKVRLYGNKIYTTEKIMFDLAKANIKPKSYPLLNEVVILLNQRKDILKVQIEGHTDSSGTPKRNRRLSASRAASVRAYLEARGIKSSRLRAVGFGQSRPIVSNRTAKGRERNRRVEFTILKWDKTKRD